jgi:hypothetical protein
MRTISQLVVYIVVACLLVSMSGWRQVTHRAHADNRLARHPQRARLRRCGGDPPAHRPVRPSKNAVLPPDEDDDDGERSRSHKDAHDLLLAVCRDPLHHDPSWPFHSRPLPTPIPRHQTLCILLI